MPEAAGAAPKDQTSTCWELASCEARVVGASARDPVRRLDRDESRPKAAWEERFGRDLRGSASGEEIACRGNKLPAALSGTTGS
jgi:hypothetical protein